jgi:hypothetical protein
MVCRARVPLWVESWWRAEATEGAIRTGCLGTADYRGKCSIACGFLDVGGGKPCSFFGKHRPFPAPVATESIKTLSGRSEPCYNLCELRQVATPTRFWRTATPIIIRNGTGKWALITTSRC